MKKIFFFFFVLISFNCYAQTPQWLWARNGVNVGGTNGAEGTYMASDAFGNAFLTGSCGDTLRFGSYTLISSLADIFLVKYDQNGNVMWAKKTSIAPGGISSSMRITTDASGNIFMTGFYTTTSLTIDGIILTNSGDQDIFIAKFDSAGNALWAKGIGGSGMESGEGIATDSLGNCVITGYFKSPSLSFDAHTITSIGLENIFIAKYDPSGNALWAARAGGSGIDIGQGIASDASNNIYVTGSTISAVAYFGNDSIYNSSGNHFFLAKYNSTGTEQWVRNSKGDGTGSGVSVTTDAAGDIITTGNFNPNQIIFGIDTLDYVNNAGFTNAFVVKYNSSGNEVWATPGIGKSYCIIADSANNTYISGTQPAVISTFDTLTLDAQGNFVDPMYVVKLNSTGSAIFGMVLSSGGDDINGIAIGPAGSIYVGGDYFFVDPFILGNDSLPELGAESAFVARFGYKPVHSTGIPENSKTDPEVNIYPNPFKSSTTILFSEEQKNTKIKITDMLGKEMKTINCSGKQLLIEKGAMKNGVYFIQITDENKNIVNKKIVIQ